MKICKECKIEKPFDEYYKYSKGGYLFPYCKRCARSKAKTQSKDYYKANSKTVIKRTKEYSLKNRDKMRPWHATYARNKRATDLNFRLAHNFRKRISNHFANLKRPKKYTKPKSVLRGLGCDIDFLVKYLEGKWLKGMNWDNYGDWEIDPIVPFFHFDLLNSDDFMKANHYSNLQPLWKLDNRRKNKNLEYNTSTSDRQL